MTLQTQVNLLSFTLTAVSFIWLGLWILMIKHINKRHEDIYEITGVRLDLKIKKMDIELGYKINEINNMVRKMDSEIRKFIEENNSE